MNRRLFLSSLAAAIAAPAMEFDPERALWVRGAKTIILPATKKLEMAKWIVFGPIGLERYRMEVRCAPGCEPSVIVFEESGTLWRKITEKPTIPQLHEWCAKWSALRMSA